MRRLSDEIATWVVHTADTRRHSLPDEYSNTLFAA
jgi:hypothetical protein